MRSAGGLRSRRRLRSHRNRRSKALRLTKCRKRRSKPSSARARPATPPDWWSWQQGLGKTWLAALDSNRPEFRRVLFVAHREEILAQAMDTFRRVQPDAHTGILHWHRRSYADADVLFASIQTLGRMRHLKGFDRRAFDYIVVDEFHHAAARTYRRLIDYFEPDFLLGPHSDARAHRRRRSPRALPGEPRLPLRPRRRHRARPALPVPLLRRARRGRLHEYPVAQLSLRRGGADQGRGDAEPRAERARAVSGSTAGRRDPRLLLLAAPRGLHGRVLPRCRACAPPSVHSGASSRPASAVRWRDCELASSTSSSPSTCSTRASTSRTSTPS